MRLIDADALYYKVKCECNPYGKPTIDFESGKKVLNWIENAPTVERPHGEWIDLSDGWQEGTYECSNCKEEFVLIEGTPEDNQYNFCPNCGASMVKEGESE